MGQEQKGERKGVGERKEGNACPQTPRFRKTRSPTNGAPDWCGIPFYPLPHPIPSTFLLSPHFSCGPNVKFHLLRTGTLATQAKIPHIGLTLKIIIFKLFLVIVSSPPRIM